MKSNVETKLIKNVFSLIAVHENTYEEKDWEWTECYETESSDVSYVIALQIL